jgi:hypothetical protein
MRTAILFIVSALLGVASGQQLELLRVGHYARTLNRTFDGTKWLAGRLEMEYVSRSGKSPGLAQRDSCFGLDVHSSGYLAP